MSIFNLSRRITPEEESFLNDIRTLLPDTDYETIIKNLNKMKGLLSNDWDDEQTSKIKITIEYMNAILENEGPEALESFLYPTEDDESYTVIWKPITDNDPIYNTNYKTIRTYINQLIKTYSEKMNVTFKEAKETFENNNPYLLELVTSVEKVFNNTSIQETTSLSSILSNQKWNEYGRHMATIIKQMLSTVKMPHYIKARDFKTQISSNNTPQNQFYWQRKAMEATTRATILEAQLQYLFGILSKISPELAPEISTDIPGETFFEMISSTPKIRN